MKLKKVIFYQAVKLWDGNSVLTVNEGENKKLVGVTITVENHMITLECPTESEIIVVGTSNMREARYWREPYGEKVEAVGGRNERPVNHHGDNEKSLPISGEVGLDSAPADVVGAPVDQPEVQPIPSGFDPSKYAGEQKEEKVTKPKAQKAVK